MKKSKLFKLTIFIIVPLVLICFWIIASTVFVNDFSFTALKYNHSNKPILQSPQGQLLKGEKITGELKAVESNLGIVVLRIKSRIDYSFEGEDTIIFRIKEKGAENWHHINSYRSGELRRTLELPIGFPKISDSKEKNYVFEIESQNGNKRNALFANKDRLSISTVYVIPSEEITASKKNLITFLIKKVNSQFSDLSFLLKSTIFLIPLIAYTLILIYAYKFNTRRSIFVFLSLSLIIFDIFFLTQQYIGLSLLLICLWIFSISIHKIKSKINFVIVFSLIAIWLVLLSINKIGSQPKLNFWVYFFLSMGTAQLIIEENKLVQRAKSHLIKLRSTLVKSRKKSTKKHKI